MLKLLLATLKAGPGDDETFGALGGCFLISSDQRFKFGVDLKYAGQQGTPVQIREDGAEHDLANSLTG